LSAQGGNGDGDGGLGDGDNSDDEIGEGPLTALREFYSALSLRDDDRQKLILKRGLTEEIIDQLGFRSSQKSNREILVRLAEKYPMAPLLQCGLYVKDKGAPKPNSQFYG